MREHLMRLDGEAKSRRRLLDPFLGRALLQHLPKGEIYFNGVELAGIVREKFRLRQFGRIKVRLPTWISPSRSADEELCHSCSADLCCSRG